MKNTEQQPIQSMDNHVDNAGQIFRSKSPLRISFAGGGTDFPHWFEKRPGAVLCSTINRYAYATVYPRSDQQVRLHSFDLEHSVEYGLNEAPIYDGALDLAKAAIHRLGITTGMNVNLRSDAPAGSGLGGSSALTAAVMGAVAACGKRHLDPYEFAALNYIIERQDVGISGGKQDQYATTFGGFNLIEFHDDRVVVNPLRIDSDIINDLEAHLMLCYTGQIRTNAGLITKQIDLASQGRATTHRGMERLYELCFEMKEALLKRQLEDFGHMLHEAYVSKKEMNPDVSSGTIADLLYDKARKHGALGGKLLGAGGGGYLLIYCPTARRHEITQEIESAGGRVASFNFDEKGLQAWRSYCA